MKKIEEVLMDVKPSVLVLEHAGRQDSVEVKYLIEALKKEFADGINILKLDTTYDGKMSERYHVEGYPTWILFKQGEELMRESGRKTQADLIDMIKRAIK